MAIETVSGVEGGGFVRAQNAKVCLFCSFCNVASNQTEADLKEEAVLDILHPLPKLFRHKAAVEGGLLPVPQIFYIREDGGRESALTFSAFRQGAFLNLISGLLCKREKGEEEACLSQVAKKSAGKESSPKFFLK